jgi:hypothetical protein
MPRTIIPHVPIDSEWAETLVGLRLNIPDKWWPGFCNGGLNRGKIAAINLDPLSSYYFEVELNDEPGAHYAMRYDSVLLYVDEEQLGFAQFHLPSCCQANPDDKIARVRVPKKIVWMVDDDYTDKEDVVVDKEAIEFNDRYDEDKDGSGDDNDDGDLCSKEVATTEQKKKRKKGVRSKSSTSKKRISPRGRQTHQSTMIL